MRDQDASVAYGAAALKAARNRNIASQMPRNEGAQAAAKHAQVASAASLGAWRRANAMWVNADRAALAVKDSADVAYRFAQVSRHHATLFEIEAEWEVGASAESRRDDHAEALADLYEAVTPRPDLEFLYVDHFLRACDAPPDRCTR